MFFFFLLRIVSNPPKFLETTFILLRIVYLFIHFFNVTSYGGAWFALVELELPGACVELAKSVEPLVLILQDHCPQGWKQSSGWLYNDGCLICKCHGNFRGSVWHAVLQILVLHEKTAMMYGWSCCSSACFFFLILLDKVALNLLLIICYSWGVMSFLVMMWIK